VTKRNSIDAETEIAELDELDREVITILQKDGRASIQDIAQQLDSTSSTIRKRIRRMEDANLMRVVAVTDFSAAGTGVHDLDILVAAKDFEELSRFMHDELPGIKGIGRLTPGLTVDVLRYESGWVTQL